MRVGFIGTGSMGSILLEAFIAKGALQPNEITASNRSSEKAEKLREKHPGLVVAKTNSETVIKSDLIFLCIRPLEFKSVIDEIHSKIRRDHLVISITTPVLIADLEASLPCKIVKAIPSITNSVAAGASLLMFGTRCTTEDRQLVQNLLKNISHPIEIMEPLTRVCSDIVSCGPAFISYLLQRFIVAAVEETGVSDEEATYLTTEMIVGFAKLISEGPFTLQTLQERVCVPGGITGAGLTALEQFNGIFNQVFKNTQNKFKDDLAEVANMLHGDERC